MSYKGKLAKFVRKLPIGWLYRLLIGGPLKTVGGIAGKLIGWISPPIVDKLEEALDEKLQDIEEADTIHDGMAESQRLGDQRPLEDAVAPSAGGMPANARDGVQTRPNREHR